MEGLICSHTNAIYAIRKARCRYASLPWEAIAPAEQRRILSSSVPNAQQIDFADLERLGFWSGADGEVLHLLVGTAAARRRREPLECHVHSGALPKGALMRVAPDVYCVSPGFAALQYARGRTLAEAYALLMELLGTYSLAPDATLSLSWGGLWPDRPERPDGPAVEQTHYRCAPVVTIRKLKALARWASGPADATFRKAVELVRPGSASPAESIMCGVFSVPMRYGGFGCSALPKGGMLLNHQVDFTGQAVLMASGMPYAVCDAFIPAANTDLEYNGIGHEEENARIHDGARNNGLRGMNVKVIVVNRDQMRDISALEAIAQSMYRDAGVRFRHHVTGYRKRQADWLNGLRRATGLPPV